MIPRLPSTIRTAATFLLACICLLSACSGTQNTMSEKNIRTFYYTDGMSNRYHVSADSITYTPIKPAQSSSGMADGGDPAQKAISYAEYKDFDDACQAAINDQASHLENRLMGCGTLTVADGKKESTYFLSMNSASKAVIEKLLKQMLQ